MMPTTPQLTTQERYNGLVFRVLLDTSARPGSIGRLPDAAPAGELPSINGGATHWPILAGMMSLLDQQTGFAVATAGNWLAAEDRLTRWIALRSRARAAAPEEADFVLLHDIASLPLISQLKRGTLSYPEQSATVFCLVDAVDGPPSWVLRGTGIARQMPVGIVGMDVSGTAAILAQRNSFPLGIDIYFIDRAANCLALPRSSTISPHGTALEAAWAM